VTWERFVTKRLRWKLTSGIVRFRNAEDRNKCVREIWGNETEKTAAVGGGKRKNIRWLCWIIVGMNTMTSRSVDAFSDLVKIIQ
jgi:hypothetical protein